MKTLYISDLDGTLLGNGALPSEFTANTVNELVEKGMNISFATARSVSSAGRIVPHFRLKLPAVMMNGVFITDIATKEQKHVCKICHDTVLKIIDAFNECGRPPIVFSYNGELDAQFTEIKSDYERFFITERQKLYHKFERTDEYDLSGDVVFINGIDERRVIDRVCERLDRVSGIKYAKYLDTYSDNKYFVEVFSAEAGKKNSVERLKNMYGFDRVVAFGDNANDVEMLEFADIAVVVGNGLPEAKAVADIVIDTNENDGVAKFLLEEFEKIKTQL